MIWSGTYSNSAPSAIVDSILFLDGGAYTKNIMTGAGINALSDDGRYALVYYQGSIYEIDLINELQFVVNRGWTSKEGLNPLPIWTELGYDYSAYLV